jgi:hypothetical protein
MQRWGWDYIFLVYGLVGFAWTLAWSPLMIDRPAPHAESPTAAHASDDGPAGIPWLAFATCRPLWAILIIETSHGEPSPDS